MTVESLLLSIDRAGGVRRAGGVVLRAPGARHPAAWRRTRARSCAAGAAWRWPVRARGRTRAS
ncbi:MAG: hypothetical protein MZV63_26885 [Marinilabiliales bacterium]|nr:hypothetical protein [Marinilabiliales bacterium]